MSGWLVANTDVSGTESDGAKLLDTSGCDWRDVVGVAVVVCVVVVDWHSSEEVDTVL